MSKISLITKLGLIVTTVGTLTVGVRYTSNFENIEEAINELTVRGKAYYTMATTSKKDLKELQDKYDTLNTTHKGILAKLQLEEGATVQEITSKIDSLVSASNEANAGTIKDIATYLGLEENATLDDIKTELNELYKMKNEIDTLYAKVKAEEGKVSELEAELAQAKEDLKKANTDQQNITTLLEACMAEVPAIEEEPGGTVEPTTTYCSTHTEVELVNGICSTCNLATLKASMDSAWTTFEAEAEDNNFYKTAEVKNGNYTLYEAENKILVSGKNQTVNEEFITALKAYEQAKTNYINAGGEL